MFTCTCTCISCLNNNEETKNEWGDIVNGYFFSFYFRIHCFLNTSLQTYFFIFGLDWNLIWLFGFRKLYLIVCNVRNLFLPLNQFSWLMIKASPLFLLWKFVFVIVCIQMLHVSILWINKTKCLNYFMFFMTVKLCSLAIRWKYKNISTLYVLRNELALLGKHPWRLSFNLRHLSLK